MASTFKSAYNNNVTTSTTVYTVPAATTAIGIGLTIANDAGGTTDITATVTLTRSTTTVKLVDAAPVPATSSIAPLNNSQRVVLQAGDVLAVSASGNADVVFSFMEIT